MAWLCAAVFALFAALQWNDPDALAWISLYGSTAVVALLFALGRPTWMAAVPLVTAAAWFARLRSHLGHGWYEIEEGREAVGLLLVAGACAWLLAWRALSRPAR